MCIIFLLLLFLHFKICHLHLHVNPNLNFLSLHSIKESKGIWNDMRMIYHKQIFISNLVKSLWTLLLVEVHSLFSENVLQRLLLDVSWHMPCLHSNLVVFVSQSNVVISVREKTASLRLLVMLSLSYLLS